MLCVFLARAPTVIKLLSDGLTIPMITGVGSGVGQVRGYDGPNFTGLVHLRLTSVKASQKIQNILPRASTVRGCTDSVRNGPSNRPGDQ